MAIGNRKRVAVGNAEDYEETCSLGTGSYGSVAKAPRRATCEFVAIKRVAALPATARDYRRRWRVKRASLESCRGNPFVVGYHGLVRAPGSTELRIVMEHVGPSLRDLFNQRGGDDDPTPLPEATVRAAMWQLLTGAEKMHALRIVHRDIKPENILVSADQSVVRMGDFGMALDMSHDDAPPQQYGRAGTMWYMAPEMLLGKTDYDTLVDTWSLGCIMAELIGRGVLFQGASTEGHVCSIIEVLGVPDDRAWPWFSSTPFATRLLPRLPYVQRGNLLRKRFPETRLSKQGFQVLSGLLTWNPDKRLTASAALKHRWFACLNVPAPAMTRKRNLASALPKMMEPLIDPLNLHKRQKRQCV